MPEAGFQPQRVLVDAAHALGSIAVIRSLGRAGHAVHACSTQRDALGFRSQYADFAVLSPSYESPQFPDFVRRYVAEHRISAVIPSEGFLLAIRSHFSEFAHLLPLSRNAQLVYRGLGKWDLFQQLQEMGHTAHLPPYQLIDLDGALQPIGITAPAFFVKLDAVHERKPNQYAGVLKTEQPDECRQQLAEVRPFYKKALVQCFVAGVGCGVFFLVWEGRVVAHFMHRRLHEVPHTGGASSLRQAWWHRDIYADALAKVKALAWQGVVMVEYRWNPATDAFYLMEMNCRFWGSLHLALYAGVDFPRLLIDCHAGSRPPAATATAAAAVACRDTFPREVQYVRSVCKDRRVSVRQKQKTIVEFFTLFFRRNIRSDLWFPGDRFLYWIRLYRFLRDRGA